MLVKQVDVYSILIDNPFEAAGATGDRIEGSNEGVPRIVRNQILIRGAPVVARSLTAAGTATVAASIAVRSKPVKPKRFLHISKRDRISKLKHHQGRNWKSAWRAEKKKFVHYNPASGKDVTAQQIRAQQRAQRNVRLPATTLRGAGGLMIAAGRLVPSMAAGAVAMSYVETKEGRPLTQTDMIGGNVRVDTSALSQDAGKIHAMTLANIEQGVFLATSVWHLGKAAKERIL